MDIFWKKMTLIAYWFLRLRPAKNVVRYMSKKSCFRSPFQKEHDKRVSTLFIFERQHLYHIYWSTRRQFSWKKSLLVIWKSLRLFVNTMSAVEKCSLPNRDNLMRPIHMQLSQKIKTFSPFFREFAKSRLNFGHFPKKMTLIAYLFLRLRPAKSVVRYMCKGPTSDYYSERNRVNGSQLFWNLIESTCSIFVDQREVNLVVKNLF